MVAAQHIRQLDGGEPCCLSTSDEDVDRIGTVGRRYGAGPVECRRRHESFVPKGLLHRGQCERVGVDQEHRPARPRRFLADGSRPELGRCVEYVTHESPFPVSGTARQAVIAFSSSRARFSLLCSVFKLMPSSSAARGLFPLVGLSVTSMSCCSASATVRPGASPRRGPPGCAGRVTSMSRGRSSVVMKWPLATMVARSMTLRSSRTLPGHEYAQSRSIARGSRAATER